MDSKGNKEKAKVGAKKGVPKKSYKVRTIEVNRRSSNNINNHKVAIKVGRLTKEQEVFLKLIDPLNYDLANAVDEAGIDDATLEMWLKEAGFASKFYSVLGFTNKQFKFIQAFNRNGCNVSMTCKAIGISRGTYYIWMNTSPLFEQLIQDNLEAQIDLVETFLHKKIQEGDTISTLFFLKTKAKARGYVEKQEIEQTVKNTNDLKKLSDEDLDSLIAQLESRK
jgi:hypothetical protein